MADITMCAQRGGRRQRNGGGRRNEYPRDGVRKVSPPVQ